MNGCDIVCRATITLATGRSSQGPRSGMILLIDPRIRREAVVPQSVRLMLAVAAWSLATTAGAQPARKPDRLAESGRLPAMATRMAFPNLRFDRPVALAYPDD